MNVETAPALSDPDLNESDLDDLGLGREDYRTLYHTMRLQREFEERVYRLFRQGRLVGAAYAGAGHEAIAAGSAYALGDADILVPMHRVIGAHFLRGHTARDMMCQYLGRANGPTAGKDGNMHCGNWDHHIVGMISHLGANIPVAAGVALASKVRGDGAVSLTYIGEGGSSIGDFHEGLNFAAVHRLPMVLIVENNKFAYSTPTRFEYACEHIVDRARGYGVEGALVDGTDIRAVYKATRDAVDLAREGGGPTLIEARCTRLLGHAQHDDAFYVPKDIMEDGWNNDPVTKAENLLLERKYFTREEIDGIQEEVKGIVDDAVDYAEQSPLPEPEEALQGVYAD